MKKKYFRYFFRNFIFDLAGMILYGLCITVCSGSFSWEIYKRVLESKDTGNVAVYSFNRGYN